MKTDLRLELSELMRVFRQPPTDYRPMPFTVLNDEYAPGRGEKQLTQLMENLAEAGYGGPYLHPRPGLITEYLTPRWFDLIRHCVKECKRLGIIPQLYDENSYPSGFSGGHVPARVPEARSRHVSFVQGKGLAALPGAFLALHEWKNAEPGRPLKREEVSDGTEWVAFVPQDLATMSWYGETIYPSLLDPRTTEAFIETTYEAYRKELGDLWQGCPSIFTDEPHLPGSTDGPWSPGLHLTPYLLGQFQQRVGYDLTEHLASLFFNVGNYRKVRYDFYDLYHHLWLINWALPLENWCRKQNIKLTGHYLEHDWPAPYATPGHVHLLAHMDWPGADVLFCYLLKGHSNSDIQGFDATPPGREPHALFTLRQVHSIANQLNKERVMNECWGAGGAESSPEDWLRIGRWLIVHGVNHLVPHAFWDTIRGGRKQDHPQNFAPQSPYFKYLRPLHDELTRLCWISNQGECVNRVLVIDSLTTGYCVARKADASDPAAIEAFKDPFSGASQTLLSTLPTRRAADAFVQDLSDAQIDFDLGDEYVIEEFGGRSENGLKIGQRTYPLVVLIPGMENLRSATVQRLREHLGQGGRLLAPRAEAFFIDGEPADLWTELQREFAGRIELYENVRNLRHRIAELMPPRVVFSAGAPKTGLAHMHRNMGDKELFFIVNSSPELVSTRTILSTHRKAVMRLDAATGETHRVECIRQPDGLGVSVEIPPGGSIVLIAADEIHEGVNAFSPDAGINLKKLGPAELIHTKRLEDNVLVVDFCSLEHNGRRFPEENVTAANHRYWRLHGFDSNGWTNIIQYRDQVLARDKVMLPGSGGIVRYAVNIAAGVALSNLKLAVECPEVWTVAVNGIETTFSIENTFRDPRIHWLDISALLRHGQNEITLTGRPFTVRQEIDQIYLLGDFALEPIAAGFRVVPSRPLSWGSWKSQGMPFYDSEVSYAVQVPRNAQRMSFPRETWGGALIVAYVRGEEIGRTYESPWTIQLPRNCPPEIELRIVGLPRNLFGPWHDPKQRWGCTGPFNWLGEHIPKTPQPGTAYGQVELGLFASPVFQVRQD